MSKKVKFRKKNHLEEEPKENNDNGISKKELYDLKKKEKNCKKKKNTAKKKKKKQYQTSLAGRIFAFIMLILMIGSIIATISYSFY